MGISLAGSRVIVLALSTSLAWAGTLLVAPEAAAAACDPQAVHSYGDLDGDSISDVVVGMPSWEHGHGAVDVRGSRSVHNPLHGVRRRAQYLQRRRR